MLKDIFNACSDTNKLHEWYNRYNEPDDEEDLTNE
jgi:hypothetical protein